MYANKNILKAQADLNQGRETHWVDVLEENHGSRSIKLWQGIMGKLAHGHHQLRRAMNTNKLQIVSLECEGKTLDIAPPTYDPSARKASSEGSRVWG